MLTWARGPAADSPCRPRWRPTSHPQTVPHPVKPHRYQPNQPHQRPQDASSGPPSWSTAAPRHGLLPQRRFPDDPARHVQLGSPAGGDQSPERRTTPTQPAHSTDAPRGPAGHAGGRRVRGAARSGVPLRPLQGALPGLRHVHHPHGMPRLPRSARMQRLWPPQPGPLRVLLPHSPRRAPPRTQVDCIHAHKQSPPWRQTTI